MHQAAVRLAHTEQDGDAFERRAATGGVDHRPDRRPHLVVGVGRGEHRWRRRAPGAAGTSVAAARHRRASERRTPASAASAPVTPATTVVGQTSATAATRRACRWSRSGRWTTTWPSCRPNPRARPARRRPRPRSGRLRRTSRRAGPAGSWRLSRTRRRLAARPAPAPRGPGGDVGQLPEGRHEAASVAGCSATGEQARSRRSTLRRAAASTGVDTGRRRWAARRGAPSSSASR